MADFIQAWCSLDEPYTVTNPTDNSGNGVITINNYDVYKNFYDFTLTRNVTGNITTPNASGEFTGLFGDWYFINATPITNSLRDSCEIRWIPLQPSGVTREVITITGKTITNAICGSFNQQKGRFVVRYSGITGGEVFDTRIYKEDRIIDGGWDGRYIVNDSDVAIFSNLDSGNYYAWVADQNGGAALLLYQFTIEAQQLWSVAGVKEIYISEWSGTTDWNNWSTANDPDYYGGLDTTKFQSTKISGFTSNQTWYEVPVANTVCSFSQALEKVRQGFIFNDVLTIGISMHEEEKWSDLSNVLTSKYVVVFKDANDQWWTFGYRHGASADAYTFGSAIGGFTFEFRAVSENKILTSLSETYVNNYIIN